MIPFMFACGTTEGAGNGFYIGGSGSCEASCHGSVYENTCVDTCPSYTQLVGDTCVRTPDWYNQFEPN